MKFVLVLGILFLVLFFNSILEVEEIQAETEVESITEKMSLDENIKI